VVHVGAALKHLLVERDAVFWRMWPWRTGGMLVLACLAAPAWVA